MKYFVTAILALGLGSAAEASTFTFDNFSHSDHVTSVTSDDGLITAGVSAVGGNINEAWAFDTTLPVGSTRDSDLEGPFPHYNDDNLPDLIAGRVLIIQENDFEADDLVGGGTITFNFATAVDFLGFTAIDDGRFTVSTSSNANTFVADLHVTDDDRRYGIFDTGTDFFGVTDLTFKLDHSGAIDSLRFVAPVPLPAGLPLLAAGLGALGFLRRRKKF